MGLALSAGVGLWLEHHAHQFALTAGSPEPAVRRNGTSGIDFLPSPARRIDLIQRILEFKRKRLLRRLVQGCQMTA